MRTKKYFNLILLFVLLLNLLIAPLNAFAESFSEHGEEIVNQLVKTGQDIYFQDKASMFSAETKEYINKHSNELYDNTKAQIVILTIDSLQDNTIEDLSLDIFRELGIGDKELNNGVLVLISKEDRKFRIQTGKGVEGCLPDLECKNILDELSKDFKSSNFDKGIIKAYQSIYDKISKEYNYENDIITDQPKQGLTKAQIIIIAIVVVIIAIILIYITDGEILFIILDGDCGSGFGGGSSDGGGCSGGW